MRSWEPQWYEQGQAWYGCGSRMPGERQQCSLSLSIGDTGLVLAGV